MHEKDDTMHLKENATLLAIIATLGFGTFSFLVARAAARLTAQPISLSSAALAAAILWAGGIIALAIYRR